MNFVSVIMVVFSVLAAIDKILGNRFGLGKEFERGFMLIGTMALSMVGMIVISPLIAYLLEPFLAFIGDKLPVDPAIVPASLFANDMGGAHLASEVAKNKDIGSFCALIVSSMMGCTISFTIPFALGVVDKKNHSDMLLGLLCGIVTIPIGCFIGGLFCLPVYDLVINLLPLIIFSGVIAFFLIKFPSACIRVFGIFGEIIKVIITIGLVSGIIEFLTGIKLIPHTADYTEGTDIIINAGTVMTGAFPMVYLLSKLLRKPLILLGNRLGINETSAMGIISSVATSATTFDMMKDMDKKGVVINSAFAVSGAFTFAAHLAFTLAFDPSYILPVILGKLTAGVFSIFVAAFIYNKISKKHSSGVEISQSAN